MGFLVGQIGFLSSLVNFGALPRLRARQCEREAKIGGLSWLVIGVVVSVVLRLSGGSTKLPMD